jgi:hydroxymethylglutaryl-CoA lyase
MWMGRGSVRVVWFCGGGRSGDVAERVRITDVSPRDGLQNEPGVIPAGEKVRLVGAVMGCGVDEVEVTSFVSPRWVPQLGDAAEVMAGVAGLPSRREGLGVGERTSMGTGGKNPPLAPPSGRGTGSLPSRREGLGVGDGGRWRPPPREREALLKAQALRKAETGPERALWAALRQREFMQLKFRRQHAIGPFIVDFFCQERLLAVELDGRSHETAEARRHDAERTRYLESLGIAVLRFSDDDAVRQTEGVAKRIREIAWGRPALGGVRGAGEWEWAEENPPLAPPSGRGTDANPPLGRPSGRGIVLSALVPNEKGLEGVLKVNAAAAGGDVARGGPLIGKVSVFAAASETFSQRNTNGSIDEVIGRFGPVVERAHGAGLRVRGYVSTVIACPFEGAIEPGVVARVARKLIEVGVDEIDLGDTIGAGTAGSVGAMLEAVRGEVGSAWWDAEKLTLHLHDTFGRAPECVVEALRRGVRSFDGSVAGLGGCPYASVPGRRAPGNISTEVLVRTVHGAGYVTGVDEERLARAAEVAREIVGGALPRS